MAAPGYLSGHWPHQMQSRYQMKGWVMVVGTPLLNKRTLNLKDGEGVGEKVDIGVAMKTSKLLADV